MGEDAKLLPIAELYDKEFLVDIENRQFRNFKDPDEVIGMHSEQGRKMIEDMQGTGWSSCGLSTGAAHDMVV